MVKMSCPRRAGFTLIELLVTLAVIALLLTLAVPRYFQNVDKAKEAVLVENLKTTRDAIDKYYADTGRYPETLTELVEKRYLRTLPMDPLTESNETWTFSPPKVGGGIYEVKSGATGVSLSGKPYAEL